jgi:phenylacetate-coenzyme A ligase PaaK-like adenylate-forming protein
MNWNDKIFNIENDEMFNNIALELFQFQYKNVPIYKSYIDINQIKINHIDNYKKIPFLPIQFFKTHNIHTKNKTIQKTFLSSGTTKQNRSKHHLADINIYQKSFLNCFKKFYGPPESWVILALLPSYVEQGDSSLIYMVDQLMKLSKNPDSQYINNISEGTIRTFNKLKQKQVLLIGVSYALLELAEKLAIPTGNWVIMETGGMKGKRKEIIRKELHDKLKNSFGVENIHSEYGMTELLSQAYAKKNGVFHTPTWMKVLIRDLEDPYSFLTNKKSGGINIIDLANVHSCSFIETQDLGKTHPDGSFEVLGRFDNTEIRGCNLLSFN